MYLNALRKLARPAMDFSNIRGDLFGGLTAGVVALPLALAFGEASGMGPIAGVYGAIFVGFFASLFGGTPTQISGPTGPMIIVFAGAVASLSGRPELIFASVVVAGAIQIVFAALRLGQYVKLVPYPVISGFMSGIGAIIIALQISRLFGHEPADTGTIPALASIPASVIDPNISALAIAITALTIVFRWPQSWGRIVPSPLAALIAGAGVSLIAPGAPVLGEIPSGLPTPILPSISADSFAIIVETAFVLALLGSIDSLLTSVVADNMSRTRHNSNRELFGQGVGNMVAGLFGGAPGAGATMRTVINIRTGGTTRLSGMTHALFLLSVVGVLAPFAAYIPHAALAAILVKVGYDIIDWTYLKRAHAGPRWDLALMALVLGLTVFVDLITAVGVGVVLAALAFVKQTADIQIQAVKAETAKSLTAEEREIIESKKDNVFLFEFGGPLSFGAAADLGHHVRESAGSAQVLILDLTRTPSIDLSAVRAMETITHDAHTAGKIVLIVGAGRLIRETLFQLRADAYIDKKSFYDSRLEALRAAANFLSEIGNESKSIGSITA